MFVKRINWENGPQNICHRNCVSYMQTSRKLEHKLRIVQKTPKIVASSSFEKEADVPTERENMEVSAPPQPPPPAPRRLTRESIGQIYDKALFVWCMKPDEKVTKRKETRRFTA